MSLHPHHNHYINNFLKNKELNAIYLSYGIFNLAMGLVSVFVPVYLYKLGYSIIEVMFYFFLLPLCFVIFSYTGARAVAKLGIRGSMLAAIILQIGYLTGLRFISDVPVLFYILPLVMAIKSMFYFYSFHYNFLIHSDRQNRGKEVSIIQMSAVAAGLLSPLVGGLLIKIFSFHLLFIAASVIMLVSLLPLLLSKEKHAPINFDRKSLFIDPFNKKYLPLTFSYTGYAIENWIGYVIWPVFLFLIFGAIESIGLLATVTGTLTFIIFYFVGKLTDKKDKKQLLKIGAYFYFFGWVGRIFVNNFFSVVFIDTYSSLSAHFVQVPWSARTYDLAAGSDYMKFIVEREVIFNLSRLIVVPFLMLIFAAGFHPYLISFAVAALFTLFYPFMNKVNEVSLAAE